MELVTAGKRGVPPRLGNDSLSLARDGVQLPHYDRSRLKAGILHFGLGAFQRAHLAAANENMLNIRRDYRWGVVGVSVRSADIRNALFPQDFLYTLSVKSIDDAGRPVSCNQIIGNLLDVLVAKSAPAAVIQRIAHPDLKIISLTVTEKGYRHDPSSGLLNFDDEDIRYDLTHSTTPRTTVGLIAWGLRERFQNGQVPLTLMSLDNLSENGVLLKKVLLQFISKACNEIHDWVDKKCCFPCSMVDRIVPGTTEDDKACVMESIGLEDAWPVSTESFFNWMIEDKFSAERPDWDLLHGVYFVENAKDFETLKLRMVNGCHSFIAYFGQIEGYDTVDGVMQNSLVRTYLAQLMRSEIIPTLPRMEGIDVVEYSQQLLQRFGNPLLKHKTKQIAIDGSQKIPVRLLEPIRVRRMSGLDISLLAFAVSTWIEYLYRQYADGTAAQIQDPIAQTLIGVIDRACKASERASLAHADRLEAELAFIKEFIGISSVFGDLGEDAHFAEELAAQRVAIRARGMTKTLQALLENQGSRVRG